MPFYDDEVFASYSQLDLGATELHAIDADYVTITQPPTMTLPAPPTAPFAGAPGNTADPVVSQVAAADLQAQIAAIQDAINAYDPADVIDVTGNNFENGIYTYGSATEPKLVRATNSLEIENATFHRFRDSGH